MKMIITKISSSGEEESQTAKIVKSYDNKEKVYIFKTKFKMPINIKSGDCLRMDIINKF